MKATLLLVTVALALVPAVALAPSASAHIVCIDDMCICPPGNEGTHVHVNTAEPDVCFDL